MQIIPKCVVFQRERQRGTSVPSTNQINIQYKSILESQCPLILNPKKAKAYHVPDNTEECTIFFYGSMVPGSSLIEASVQKTATKIRASEWWLDEDGLFNLDDEARAEKQQCAVAASNIIRNFSFMPDNEVIMAQHRHCLETVFQCMEDHEIGEMKRFHLKIRYLFFPNI